MKKKNNSNSINRWVDKQIVYIETTEYYSATESNELLTHASTRMNLKIIILREKS